MNADPKTLMAASAGIMLFLGSLHLLYTFQGKKLYPRDTHLERQMDQVSPVISRQTTIWRCWIGFNASHSLGAMLFGLVYGYLALRHTAMLFDSTFLLLLGAATLGAYTWLAKTYWFSVPLAGIALALLSYGAAVVGTWLS